jgi:hypothetical protein
VTCVTRNLKEFTRFGKQLREISFQSNIDPHHAILLSSGQFVVCHGVDQCSDVREVDVSGHIIQSYRDSAARGEQLNWPLRLAVDVDESIVVADSCNHRVLLLSPNLSYVRQLVSRDQLEEADPHRLCLDVNSRRLYVAVDTGVLGGDCGRVVVVSW